MSSEEEFKEIETLTREIAKRMDFDDLDLTIEKDKSGTLDFMMITYSLWSIEEIPNNIKNYLERIRERIREKITHKKYLPEPVSKLCMELTLGRFYKLKIKEGLSHELGHARFFTDHPVLESLLYLISLPYSYPQRKLKEKYNFIHLVIYCGVGTTLSYFYFPYGTASFAPILAYHMNEYIANFQARKRGLSV